MAEERLREAAARARVLQEMGEPKTFNSAMARVEAGMWVPGYMLRWMREQEKITLRRAAELIGVSAPFWSDVEHGRRWVSSDRHAAVAKALGARPDVIAHLSKYIRCGFCGRVGQ